MRECAWKVGGSAGRPVREAREVRSQLFGEVRRKDPREKVWGRKPHSWRGFQPPKGLWF